MGAVVGPVLLGVGVWLGSSAIADRIHFDGFPRANAVVVGVDYVKPTLKEDVSSMDVLVSTDGGQESMSVADPKTAPGGLSAGDKVVVLFDSKRSAEAIFPSQLGWGKLLPGLGFTGIGSVATIAGVLTLVRRTRSRRMTEQ